VHEHIEQIRVHPERRRARGPAPLPQHGRRVRRACAAEHARTGARGHRVRARGARDGPDIWGGRGVRHAGAGAGAAPAVGERTDVPRARVWGAVVLVKFAVLRVY
jgi:hypothetical protein